MNRLDWVQKEPYIEYHVLKWPTSHLHPRRSVGTDGGLELKGGLSDRPEASDEKSAQPEGIGMGFAERSESARWRTGGFGEDGMAQSAVKEAVHDKDCVSISSNQAKRQMPAQQAVPAAAETIIPHETTYNMVYRAGWTVRRAGRSIRETIGRLRDVYQKQQKKSAARSKNNSSHLQSRHEQRGTRQVSKDEVLAMQSENHYLLDSYDKNGEYSVLGK